MTAATTSSALGSMSSSSGRARGDDPVARRDPLHGRAQITPRRLLDARSYLGAEAARERALLGGDEGASSRDGLDHGVELHRDELGERDNLTEDLLLEDELGHRIEDDGKHPAVGHDGRAPSVKFVAENMSAG